MLNFIKKFIPKKIFRALQPTYHYCLALMGALIYRFPSRNIHVVFITGTKGKSSTAEILNSILEAAGKKTALAGTIRFKIGDNSRPNKFKMTVQGRAFLQRFLRQAVNAGCEYAILEMTSEAAKQYRHLFININGLLFLNLSPEHIESHGGYDKYVRAKLLLAQALQESPKKHRILVANKDDKEAEKFLAYRADKKIAFSIKDAEPYEIHENGEISMTYIGHKVKAHLRGLFNIYNILAAAAYAEAIGIKIEDITTGIEQLTEISGRVQNVAEDKDFEVIVDYAHTADSLEKLYRTFENKRKICVLGNTGGGRDKWKRPEMAKIADTYCDEIILTNEDPYDEDPKQIINEMLPGIASKKPEVIMDRRTAINTAIRKAKTGDVVLITGKGTDPYIMEANNKKTPWSDASVAREELQRIFG